MISPEQNPCLGRGQSLGLSPKGSKAPKSSDLRGNSKLKLLIVSEDPVFLGNGKSKTLPVQTLYLIHVTTPGTNDEVYQKFDRLLFFRLSE